MKYQAIDIHRFSFRLTRLVGLEPGAPGAYGVTIIA